MFLVILPSQIWIYHSNWSKFLKEKETLLVKIENRMRSYFFSCTDDSSTVSSAFHRLKYHSIPFFFLSFIRLIFRFSFFLLLLEYHWINHKHWTSVRFVLISCDSDCDMLIRDRPISNPSHWNQYPIIISLSILFIISALFELIVLSQSALSLDAIAESIVILTPITVPITQRLVTTRLSYRRVDNHLNYYYSHSRPIALDWNNFTTRHRRVKLFWYSNSPISIAYE